jgi:class 3 adenylate cyclase
MTERVVVVPHWVTSPAACELIPADAKALRALRDRYQVEIVVQPVIRGAPTVAPRWSDQVSYLRTYLEDPCHVIALAYTSAVTLLSLDSQTQVRSFITTILDLPLATIRSFGFARAADAVQALSRTSFSRYLWILDRMPDTPEGELRQLAAMLDSEFDAGYAKRSRESYDTIDLLRERPNVLAPTLYLDSPVVYRDELKAGFLQLVPQAEVAVMEHWPYRLDDPTTADEFVAATTAFIDKNTARSVMTTVLFIDIVDSTQHAAELGDRRWADLLAAYLSTVRHVVVGHAGHEVDTAGDGFLATFDSTANAIRCGLEARIRVDALALQIRAAVHLGECELVGGKVAGLPVHVASRINSAAGAGEIFVSETVYGLLAGAEFSFQDRGTHRLKGVPGQWRLYAVLADSSQPASPRSTRAMGSSVFRREGDYWAVAYHEESARLKDSKGMRYIALLLATPDHHIHVMELVAAAQGVTRIEATAPGAEGLTESPGGDLGEALDPQAREAYKNRIRELDEELEEAESQGDRERATRARAEMDFLLNQLAADIGIGGRHRPQHDPAERARQSVSKAIHSALKHIARDVPELAQHLESTIHTGLFCRYVPGPRPPIAWNL